MKKIMIIMCLVVFFSSCATTPEQKAAGRNFLMGMALGMQNANQQQALEVQKRAAVGMNMPVYFPDGTVVNPPQRIYAPVYTLPSQPYHATISQNSFSDLSGNPVYTITGNDGQRATIKQRPFRDLSGNPVYDVQ